MKPSKCYFPGTTLLNWTGAYSSLMLTGGWWLEAQHVLYQNFQIEDDQLCEEFIHFPQISHVEAYNSCQQLVQGIVTLCLNAICHRDSASSLSFTWFSWSFSVKDSLIGDLDRKAGVWRPWPFIAPWNSCVVKEFADWPPPTAGWFCASAVQMHILGLHLHLWIEDSAIVSYWTCM